MICPRELRRKPVHYCVTDAATIYLVLLGEDGPESNQAELHGVAHHESNDSLAVKTEVETWLAG
jgi:hypothetical protein